MKKVYLISSIILILLIVLSTQTFLSASLDHTNKGVIKLQTENQGCLAPTYKIYPEAAKMWKDSWGNLYKDDSNNELRILTAEDLIKLSKGQNGEDANSEGLRFYYGLINDSSDIPELIIVNTVNCQDMVSEDELAILVTADGSREISMVDAANYTERWQKKRSNSEKTSVYAYNYRWDEITSLVGTDIDKDMQIEYGLRTLSPDENRTEFESAISPGQDIEDVKFGSIVYVNILSVFSEESLIDDEGQLDNFARPCPRYCDPDSTILTNNLTIN